MTYESDAFREHHLVRLPLLEKLLDLGWSREQIICPSPGSDDAEWRIPKTPSEASKRERGHRFEGFPCDMAIFDSPESVGEWDHVEIIVETKAPEFSDGVSELEIYLSREPNARLGIWSNGADISRVYKLSDGTFEVERASTLPRPTDNIIHAGKHFIYYDEMDVPSEARLKAVFSRILGTIAATDTVSTRPEQRLNEICNILMVKLESDNMGLLYPNDELAFQLNDEPCDTRENLNVLFRDYKTAHPALFGSDDADSIRLDDESIQKIVLELQYLNLKDMEPTALSMAFQVFRAANLKIGDGQYFTPWRVIRAGTKMMQISAHDKVIDPACGTGGFISAAYMSVLAECQSDAQRAEVRSWAHHNLFGVDRDAINVKLTRALMVGIGDGSTHAYVGDSVRQTRWMRYHSELSDALAEGSYTVVLTNPPFGNDLKISARDARSNELEVCCHTAGGEVSSKYAATELGIVFVERAWRLLKDGGRLGIVLPETYFFSKSYRWFREWISQKFILRGVLNIPMEAFQGFCRAKTNFYVFEKRVSGAGESGSEAHFKPGWFTAGKTWVSYAPTIGINKDGLELYQIDAAGQRTGIIDDVASSDVDALIKGDSTHTSRFIDITDGEPFIGIPQYSNNESILSFRQYLNDVLPDFKPMNLGQLIDSGLIMVRVGHGSPSSDLRQGDIPYVKVSDLRAGLINVNRTNLVSRRVAESFWKGSTSGLRPFDIVTPSRASKNIGEPTILLPTQLDIVLTKEVLVFSVSPEAPFDAFYLMWALDLDAVLAQWSRIVFMQTNREDLGDRYREISIPFPPDRMRGEAVSSHYRAYYSGLAAMREEFLVERKRQNELQEGERKR